MTARVQQFRCLNQTIHSWLPTGLRLPVANVPRGRVDQFAELRLHCPGSFAPRRYQRRTCRQETAGGTAGEVVARAALHSN